MTLVLTHSQIAGLLDRDEVRKVIELAHAELARGDYQNPAPHALALSAGGAVLPMVAAGDDMLAVKLLCDLPDNRDSGLPTQRSTITVTSALTGECLAILDGRAITAVRTAAASAVATDYLSRESASVLGLIGAGNLAVEHTRAIAAVRDIERVVVWSRSRATIEAFRSAVETLSLHVDSVQDPATVMAEADIVCTLTPARDPVVSGAWLRPGQHVNAVGAPPRADHREVDAAGMKRARVIVDSRDVVLAKSGGVLLAIAEGAITAADVTTELGQVVIGTADGRTADRDITLFESVGIGLQDLATAALVIGHATTQGIGIDIDLGA
jgi:ornithine cyclodeaminase/alanine dehydrogenase-like protein (mu-crystallin family)